MAITNDGLCVVEWPASLPAELVESAARIELEVTGETTRRITLLEGEPRFQRVFEQRAVSPAVSAGAVPGTERRGIDR